MTARWTTSGGEYVPAGFQPRGPVWPGNAVARFLLTASLIDLLFPLKCEVFDGTVARLDRKKLPKSWKKQAGSASASADAAVTDRHALIWLQEYGDTLIGYAFTAKLGKTQVGDRVTLWVKPHSGSVRRLKNHTRPRKSWQH